MAHRRSCITVKVVFLLSVLFSLAVFLSLSSCRDVGYVASGGAAKEGLEIRAMTFNIRYGTAKDGENSWENRRELLYNVLRDNQPDIVGLQEALHFQIREILQTLPHFNYLGVGREDGKTKSEYCAILYRIDRFDVNDSSTFWFSDTPEVPGSITWGNANTRICTWSRFIDKKSGKAFYVYNLHLDHVSQPSREKSVVLLANRITGRNHSDPFIVTGDFNAGESNPAVLYLEGKTALSDGAGGKLINPVPMLDAFRVLHPDATEVGTFNGFKGNTTGEKIDYILVPKCFEVIEANIVRIQHNGRYPSDHFPITAHLRLSVAGN